MSLFRKKKIMPNGLWVRCDGCKGSIYKKTLEQRGNVCPDCDYHFRISCIDRIKNLLDDKSFKEYWSDLRSADPLGFVDRISYKERILEEQQKTGLKSACIAGKGKIFNKDVIMAATDPSFVMGSMGSVVGEKITRSTEMAMELELPLIIVTGSGGGARMQEGAISLMQMAKTSAAVARFHETGGLYIAIITDPTLGGVMASFASQADIIIAEPNALIGFAGPRVIEQTIKKSLPPGFQTSEFMLAHGFIDMIVDRNELKITIADLLVLLTENKKQKTKKDFYDNTNKHVIDYETLTISNNLEISVN